MGQRNDAKLNVIHNSMSHVTCRLQQANENLRRFFQTGNIANIEVSNRIIEDANQRLRELNEYIDENAEAI